MMKAITILLALILIAKFCLRQTDGFFLAKIAPVKDFAYQGQNTSTPPPRELLSQPFFYLGRGAQTFAFASEDGKTVIKFLMHSQARHHLDKILFLLPSSWRTRLQESLEKRKKKFAKDCESFALAEALLKKETGLLYVHLTSTDTLVVHLFDKIGIKHQIDVGQMVFVIQKKATPFYPTLEKWIDEEEMDRATQGLSTLVYMLKKRMDLALYDKDPKLATNFGFIEDQPIQFDIGRFKKEPSRIEPTVARDDLIRYTDRLCHWLEKKAPPLRDYVIQTIEEVSCSAL